ncbi:MAG: NHLP bacteriocin export ABC transporter permease/ATPase subunit [Acidimicrobiia bacterium]|nr:NHLP bacteriocin export ABC transporter permease/ATPase subunit [Acidimicrobiia bacterium]
MAEPDQDLAGARRLAQVASANGEPFAASGNRPIPLDDPEVAWYVERGAVDVFLAEQVDGEAVSSSKHLLRVGEGRLVFGVGDKVPPLATVAKGLPDTSLYRVAVSALTEHGGSELAAQVDEWLAAFASTVATQIDPRPYIDMRCDPGNAGEVLAVEAGNVLSTRGGKVIWVAGNDGSPSFLGTEDPIEAGTGLVPLTSDTWVTFGSAATVVGMSSSDLLERGELFEALDDFHALALAAEHFNRMLLLADEVNEQAVRSGHRQRDHERAREDLFTVLDRTLPGGDAGDSELLSALRVIGDNEGIEFRRPPIRGQPFAEPSLSEILDVSGIRARKVRLLQSDRWWLGDSGAMLGFTKDDGRPVALVPGFGGRYRAVDVASGRKVRLNAGRARDLADDAWLFYPVLPPERSVGARDILRLARKGAASDFAPIVITGLLVGLLTQVPAIAVGLLADQVLPFAAGGMLVQVVVALAAFAAIGVLLRMLQGAALMRFEGRAGSRLGAAAWDRLLALPTSFFRNFTAGDLAVRMATFQVLRAQLSGVATGALLSFVFLLPTLTILFAYDVRLALVSLAVALLTLTVTTTLGILQIAPQRRRYEAARRLSSELLQFINGMAKLRLAGAEASAFASWARGYRAQHLASIQISRLNEHLVSFSAALPALIGVALFGVVLARGPEDLTVGEFLVVFSVSMTFFAAVSGLGRSIGTVAAVLPGYEQVKPILEAVPESRQEGVEHIVLEGEVRFDRVGFRYLEDGPPVIDDISIHARPGEFVAIVGESGAGKSTLMRLALGLEEPNVGGVYYDGHDLANLDHRSVRRQIGVVMQDGMLQPGTLLDNIIGMSDDLTIDDAWQAARLADVESDIAEMPMEMLTVIGDNSSLLSGGQIQRIRIAAALVRNPRVVLLDEATSWLDARSQAQVMRGIESLAATRIVIAHRLSTIRKAERIYVLDSGRVVQQGTFDELYAVEGTFRRLVQRQLK